MKKLLLIPLVAGFATTNCMDLAIVHQCFPSYKKDDILQLNILSQSYDIKPGDSVCFKKLDIKENKDGIVMLFNFCGESTILNLVYNSRDLQLKILEPKKVAVLVASITCKHNEPMVLECETRPVERYINSFNFYPKSKS